MYQAPLVAYYYVMYINEIFSRPLMDALDGGGTFAVGKTASRLIPPALAFMFVNVFYVLYYPNTCTWSVARRGRTNHGRLDLRVFEISDAASTRTYNQIDGANEKKKITTQHNISAFECVTADIFKYRRYSSLARAYCTVCPTCAQTYFNE